MTDTNELLGLAIEKNPTDFADVFQQLIQQKQLEAIEQRRMELAQSLYADPQELEPDVEESDEYQDDLDDDLEDLDIDLDDLGPFDLEDTADDENY